jgi:hypothetical protein
MERDQQQPVALVAQDRLAAPAAPVLGNLARSLVVDHGEELD